ncbi:hypothetical protein KSP40_PGU018930 [Platanthera guangdongensis]|uniref:Uncharacterized protein n=1 Tax=Platanthera guangdongensis TaxID=2320717 RepID=A0ABR2LG93_9ASPA
MTQYQNITTVLTREYLDVRSDGWLDYAAKKNCAVYGEHVVELRALSSYVGHASGGHGGALGAVLETGHTEVCLE